MALPPLMQALGPDWNLIVIGQGSQTQVLDTALAPLGPRYRRIPSCPTRRCMPTTTPATCL